MVQIRSFFLVHVSCIRTEYGDLRSKYGKNSIFGHFCAVLSPADLNLLPSRHIDVIETSLTDVALTSPYSYDENVGRRCKNDVVATCHKGVIFATSSDVSIAIM